MAEVRIEATIMSGFRPFKIAAGKRLIVALEQCPVLVFNSM
jgi:hypothetical protein